MANDRDTYTGPLFAGKKVPPFGGETYEPRLDGARLLRSLDRVFALVSDGEWHTIPELARKSGSTEAGVSARLRDLRKTKFGGFTVERRREDGGLWTYRLAKGTR